MVAREMRRRGTVLMAMMVVVTAAILTVMVQQAVAGEPTAARVLALSCAACHGPGGASPGSIPSLKGKDPVFIAEALRAFRDGSRPATVMGRIATGYSDAEIEVLSRQFAHPAARQ
ncbi:MAG: hypothetical protein P1U65_04735 [Minwuia sp.]|nr:hypothetical protein [Minwuia sp.]